jgi:hypothetical protein
MFTKETIEAALDSGQLETEVTNGTNTRWWRLRRNGATRTWRTRPSDFRIPTKAGLRAYGEITHLNMNSGHFRISPHA